MKCLTNLIRIFTIELQIFLRDEIRPRSSRRHLGKSSGLHYERLDGPNSSFLTWLQIIRTQKNLNQTDAFKVPTNNCHNTCIPEWPTYTRIQTTLLVRTTTTEQKSYWTDWEKYSTHSDFTGFAQSWALEATTENPLLSKLSWSRRYCQPWED